MSHDLLVSGKKITYLYKAGSQEEVAPSLSSFIARRRRWSHGHTQSFFHHLREVLSSSLMQLRDKLILLYHGIFFLIPVLVTGMLNVLAVHFLPQYPLSIVWLLGFIALILSLALSLLHNRKVTRILYDTIFALPWIWPQMVLFYPFFTWLMGHKIFYFLINFPYFNGWLGVVHVYLILFPLILSLLGHVYLRMFSFKQFILLFLTYPIHLFFNIYSSLLGFFDYLFA